MLIFTLLSINIFSLFAQIPVSCQSTVTLNTGYNHGTNATYAVGAWDNYWTVIGGPGTSACGTPTYPSPAAVIPISVGWGSIKYPNSEWLSFRPTAVLSCNNTCAAGDLPVVFQRKFCMLKPDTVTINVRMRFDNSACLFVDGTPTGTLGTNIPLSPVLASSNIPTAFATISGATGCLDCYLWNDTKTFNGNYDAAAFNYKIYLTAGMHNIQMRVRNNSSVSFGAMLTGTVTGKTQQNNFICPNDCQVNGGITIQKVLDNNCDGKNNAGDAIGTGWQFNITGPNGAQTVTTDVTGYAFITGLNPGTYTVTEVVQSGWTATTPTQTAVLTTNQTSNLVFFNCPKPCINFAQTTAVCGQIINGVQTYTISGLISNGNNIAVPFNPTVSSGTITGLSITTVNANTLNQPFSFTYTPGINNPCFTVKFITPTGVQLCIKEFCLTLPQCPKPCINITQVAAACGAIVNGVQTYTISGLISNGNNLALPLSIITGSGTVTASFPTTVTANASNLPFSFTYTPGSLTPCFVARFLTDNGTVLCLKDFCPVLPICKCLDLNYVLKCNPSITPNTPQPYVYQVTITNPTSAAISIPMSSSIGILSPSIINALPGTNTYNVYYTPNAGSTKACILFGVGIVPLPIPLCKIPVECVLLPNCCLDADGKLTCGAIINQRQTYNFSGSIINYSSAVTPVITANVLGTITGLTPPTLPGNASSLVSFVFTPTGIMPANICFYFAPGNNTKICDSVCVAVPDCPKPCIDVTKLDAKCEIINGINTIVVTGMLNTSTSVVTSLNINPSVTITSGGTIPANAIGHSFSFQYVPSTYAASHCFIFSPSHPVIDYKLCKDTFCIKNPCPPVVTGNKCCPTTKMIACCITANEIKYEFTAATVPTTICGMIMTVTPSSGVISGNAYYPGGPATSIVLNGYTAFAPPVSAGTNLTYYITIPVTNPLSTVTIKYVTCAGNKKDTCDVEKFTIGKKNILDATDVFLADASIKDTLFAKSFKIDFSKVKNKGKVKSVSIIPNDANVGQDVFFAVTGAEQFGNENKALIPLWGSLQGTTSATFIFKDALNSENYKGEVLNIVTRRRVKEFKVMMFDEDGLLMSSSTIAGAMQPTSVSSKELKSNISSLSIAPNPANEDVNLIFTLDVAQKISIDLYDVSGKWMKNIDSSFHGANQSQPLQFNVSEFSNGLYFIRLTNESGQIFTQKLNVLH
jgi:hypothetical protein